MLVLVGISTSAAVVGVDGPLSSSSTTASCAWREKDEYRRKRSIRT